MSVRPRWLLPAAFVLLGLIWGSSFLWIKIAVDEIPPASLVAWRMGLGAVGMLLLLAVIRVPMPRGGREWLPLMVLGAINAAIPIFLISWGEQFVDSGTAAVLNSLTPIFSLLIAGVALRVEPVTGLRVGGLVLGFLGAALLASRELDLRAVVLAALSYAFGASYARHRIQSTHRYVVAAGTLVFAAIDMAVLAVIADGGVVVPTQPETILAVAWLGLLGSFVAYVCFFFLIEHLGATITSMVSYIFPVVGVALGVLVLGEQMDARLIVGTALVLAGIIVVTLRYDAAVSRIPSGVRQ